MRSRLHWKVATAVVVIASACSASDVGTDENINALTTDDAAAAAGVVRISTEGTFVSPEFGLLDSLEGSGSGFVIDPTGLIVTNNHVVAGAASIEVTSSTGERLAASVVGRAECDDVALLRVDAQNLPALSWTTEPVEVGLAVEAIGYPGDAQSPQRSEGVVAEIDQNGATPWASIPALVRHDAALERGNSGGPIVGSDGSVLGINVAGAAASDHYAIPAELVRPIVERLLDQEDTASVGLNTVAVVDEATGQSGVWVVSVENGSDAEVAEILPGDVITRLNGVRVGRDGTLADYCRILRSGAADPIRVEITRDDQFLAGEIRGVTLTPVLTALGDVTAPETGATAASEIEPDPGVPHLHFDKVVDSTGTISFDVPTRWTDRSTTPIFLAGADRPHITASEGFDDLDASLDGDYDLAGVEAFVAGVAVPVGDAFEVLSSNWRWYNDCVRLPVQPFEDTVYVGVLQAFVDCAGTTSTVVSIALERPGDDNRLFVTIFAPTIADLEAATRIVSSFELAPS